MNALEQPNKFAKWMAFILNDLVKIPGTDCRIGLDPLIGLIPGAGNFLTSSAGFTILATGAKQNSPS